MVLNISQIGQIAPPGLDVDRGEAFYEQVLGLRKLYRFGNFTFFDCAGVRLPLEKTSDLAGIKRRGWIEFRCADIAPAVAQLGKRRPTFDGYLHLIAKMRGHDLCMAFFKDPDGHILAPMQEAPKGYSPQATIY
jgi:methylmalonyl-CoA/ethylmalonyl-CoA epimerase